MVKVQSPPQIFYFIIMAFIVLIGLNFAGDYTQEERTTDPQIEANKNNLDFLMETNKALLEAVAHQTIRSVENADEINKLLEYDEIITTQIGNIRSDIISKFPQASDVEQQEQTSTAGTPFLTLKMDKKDFVLGNVVIFTGTATPSAPVFLTLKLPDRGLESLAISKTAIIDGSWTANFTLRLDDPIGTWQVYARQQADQTKTLTFTVE